MNTTPNPVHIRTRVPKFDKFNVEIVLRVRLHFDEEHFRVQSFNLNGVFDRSATTTGVSARIMNKIRTEEYLEN